MAKTGLRQRNVAIGGAFTMMGLSANEKHEDDAGDLIDICLRIWL